MNADSSVAHAPACRLLAEPGAYVWSYEAALLLGEAYALPLLAFLGLPPALDEPVAPTRADIEVWGPLPCGRLTTLVHRTH